MHKFLLFQITSNDNQNYQVGTQKMKTNQPVKENEFTRM